jgi:hypothetical protein
MPTRLAIALFFFATAVVLAQRQRVSEDRDLIDRDVTGWQCLNLASGAAKNPDATVRNRMKNRSTIDLTKVKTTPMDTAAFLQHVADFDSQTKEKHRSDLSSPQRQQLDSFEKEIVTLTGWLNLAYAGPPESTNCGSSDFHDWHLEVSEKPSDHGPRVGDPTPIICEITPRTQRAIYRDNIRIQNMTAFFRRPDMTDEPTGHPARKIRLTGFLAWDDEHNGSADVGTTVARFAANGFHQPWRSTAWEIHPVIKIEVLDATSAEKPSSPTATPAPSETVAAAPPEPTAAAPPTATPQQFATIVQPIKIKIPYGETTLAPGTKLPIVSRSGQTVVVKFMDGTQSIPISSTDLR